jgi:Ni/Co efflux regulator RcnB
VPWRRAPARSCCRSGRRRKNAGIRAQHSRKDRGLGQPHQGRCGGQGRDRTADLAVFSRWTRGAAVGKTSNGTGQMAGG